MDLQGRNKLMAAAWAGCFHHVAYVARKPRHQCQCRRHANDRNHPLGKPARQCNRDELPRGAEPDTQQARKTASRQSGLICGTLICLDQKLLQAPAVASLLQPCRTARAERQSGNIAFSALRGSIRAVRRALSLNIWSCCLEIPLGGHKKHKKLHGTLVQRQPCCRLRPHHERAGSMHLSL